MNSSAVNIIIFLAGVGAGFLVCELLDEEPTGACSSLDLAENNRSDLNSESATGTVIYVPYGYTIDTEYLPENTYVVECKEEGGCSTISSCTLPPDGD